ncbi:hypothetical protein GQX74_006324 [Glossina fuscipes]|nr:hypothetical protein GQX74_006324 [Glossina fuscipes]
MNECRIYTCVSLTEDTTKIRKKFDLLKSTQEVMIIKNSGIIFHTILVACLGSAFCSIKCSIENTEEILIYSVDNAAASARIIYVCLYFIRSCQRQQQQQLLCQSAPKTTAQPIVAETF